MKKILLVDDQPDRFRNMRRSLIPMFSQTESPEIYTINAVNAGKLLPNGREERFSSKRLPVFFDLILLHGRDKRNIDGKDYNCIVWYGNSEGPDPDAPKNDEDHLSIFRAIGYNNDALSESECQQLYDLLYEGHRGMMFRAIGSNQKLKQLEKVVQSLLTISTDGFNFDTYQNSIGEFLKLADAEGRIDIAHYPKAIQSIKNRGDLKSYQRTVYQEIFKIHEELRQI